MKQLTLIVSALAVLCLSGTPVAFAEDGSSLPPPPKLVKPLPPGGPGNFDHGPLIGKPEDGEHMSSTTGPRPPKEMMEHMGSTTLQKPPLLRPGEDRERMGSSTMKEMKDRMGSSTERGPKILRDGQLAERAKQAARRSVLLLEAGLKRADGLIDRINSRISKVTGVDLSSAKTHLDEAQSEVDAGHADLDAVQTAANTGSTTVDVNAIKDAAKSANEHAHAAMDHIKAALDALKSAAEAAGKDLNN